MARQFSSYLLLILCLFFAGCRGTHEPKEKLIEKGLIYENLRQFTKAIGLYEQALDQDPFYVQAYLRKGKCLQEMGNYPQALEIYKKGFVLDESNLALTRALAEINYLLANYPESITYCEKVKEKEATDGFTLNLLGKIYAAQGNSSEAEIWFRRALESNPTQDAYLQDLVRLLNAQRRIIDALNACQKFLDGVDPAEHLQISLLKADALLELNRPKEFLDFILKLHEAKSADPEILSRLARYYLFEGDDEKALDYTDQALKLAPNHLQTLLVRGTLMLRQKKYQEALVLFQSLAQQFPNWPEVHLKLAAAYQAQSQWEQAKTSYRRLLQMIPNYIPAKMALANIYLRDGWHDESQKLCESILEAEPENVDALKIYAASLLLQKKYTEAIAIYQKIMILSPDTEQNHTLLAELYMASGKFQLAYQEALLALKETPDDHRMMLVSGICLNTLGNVDLARQIFQKIVEQDPAFIPARKQLGQIYFSQKLWSAAEEQYQAILKSQPEDFDVLLQLGRIYFAQDKFDQAEEFFQSLLEKFPEEESIYYELGRFYAQQKRIDEAIEKFEMTIKQNPNHLLGYLLLANLYRQKNDLEKAEAVLQKLIQLKPQLNLDNELILLMIAEGKTREALDVIKTLSIVKQKTNKIQISKGFALLLRSENAEALITFRRLVEQFPRKLVFTMASADAFLQLGYANQADELIQKLYSEFPEVHDWYLQYQNSLPKDQGSLKELLSVVHRYFLFAYFQWGAQIENEYKKLPQTLQDNPLLKLIYAAYYMQSRDWDHSLEILDSLLAVAPSSSYLHVERAFVLLNKEDFSSCFREFYHAMELNPESSSIKVGLIKILLQRDADREAERIAKILLQQNPEMSQGYLLLSEIYLKQKRNKELVDLLEPYYRKNLEDLQVALKLGQAYFQLNQYEKSIEILQQLAQKNPKHIVGNSLYLRSLLAAGLFDEALYLAADIQRNIPQLNIDMPLILIYLKKGEYENALQVAQTVPSSTLVSPTNLFVIGLTYQMNKDLEQAKNYYWAAAGKAQDKLLYILAYLNIMKLQTDELAFTEEVKKLLGDSEGTNDYLKMLDTLKGQDPLFALNFLYLSIISQWDETGYQGLKKYLQEYPKNLFFYKVIYFLCEKNQWLERKETHLKDLLKYYPKDEMALLELGKIYLTKEKIQEAESYFAQVLVANPESTQALVFLGMIATEQNKPQQAIGYYTKALALDSNNVVVLNNLAYLYSTPPHLDLNQAVIMAQKALQLSPRSGTIADTLGWIYYQKGQFAEALVHLKHAEQLVPYIPDVHYHLGKTYLALEDKSKAKASFEELLRLSPKGPLAKEAKTLLDSLN